MTRQGCPLTGTNASQWELNLARYLAEEVLHRQEPFVRIFLLETSILAALTPALRTVMTGRGAADAILADLYRRNLFLTDVLLGAPAASPVAEGRLSLTAGGPLAV